MSRLEGFEELEKLAQREPYVPGTTGFHKNLVDRIVRQHEDGTISSLYWQGATKGHRMCSDRFIELIEPEITPDFDANRFLDEVITALTLRPVVDPSVHFQSLNPFCSPLLQALYDFGYNDFLMQMPSPECDTLDMAMYLEGSRDRPLTVVYSGRVGQKFGYRCKNCELTLRGSATQVGRDSTDCTFVSYAVPTFESLDYGSDASSCEFEIHSERYGLGLHLRNSIVSLQSVPEPDSLYEPISGLSWRTFFHKGNELFIPDGKDGWDQLVLKDGDWEVLG